MRGQNTSQPPSAWISGFGILAVALWAWAGMGGTGVRAENTENSYIGALIAQLESEDRQARLDAATKFITIGPIGGYARAAVSHLVVLVEGDDDEMRMAAISAVERIGSQASVVVPALIAALGDANPDVRFAAADALKRYSNRASGAVPVLIKTLDDPEPAVVYAAANALSHMGIIAVVALTPKLDDARPDIRAVVVGALGAIGFAAQPALGDILPLVDDRNAKVRAAAVRAIGQIASEHETEIRVNRGLEFKFAAEVTEWMANRETQMRQTTSDIARTALPQLTIGLRDPDQEVRFAAATALKSIGVAAADSVPNLIDATEDDAPKVRRAVAGALGRIAPPEITVPVLATLLSDADLSVGFTAAREIRRYGDDAIPALMAVLEGDAPPEIRAAVTRILGENGTGDAVVPATHGTTEGTTDPAQTHSWDQRLNAYPDILHYPQDQ